MRDARDETADVGVSPGTWAILPAVLLVPAFCLLFLDNVWAEGFLFGGTKPAATEYYYVEPSWWFAPIVLGLGTVLAVVGMRLRSVLRSWGDRSGLPDVAGAGALLAGPSAVLAAMLGLVAALDDYLPYETNHLDETLYLVVILLWTYPLTVGIGLMCAAAVWSLHEHGQIGSVRTGLGTAAALVAVLSPLTLLLPVAMGGVAFVGQAGCLAWIIAIPRERR